MFHPDDRRCPGDPFSDRRSGESARWRFEREFQIFAYRVARIKRELLQHESDVALGETPTVYVLPIEESGSGIRRRVRNQTQGRGYAGSGWAEERKELPVIDIEIEGGPRDGAGRLADSFEPAVRHISYPATPARCRTAS